MSTPPPSETFKPALPASGKRPDPSVRPEFANRRAEMNPHPEAKRATQDGMIWPLPRASMRDRDQITLRMAEDMATALRLNPSNEVTDRDLAHLGWEISQINRHGDRAAKIMAAKEALRGKCAFDSAHIHTGAA
jgi:hypothetical protein